ncbi:glycosyltransferase family 2 protein [Streptococcus infantis]|uniref:glycosyltransferase family 2 protein n=1 Tax=Streptococcus TaxID=1301 RepID=UPI0008D064B6|nr:glycosyltransferase family 2 protein [Streptococcus sp. HMSC056C01]OFK90484.1 glycosyl transferase family 2 [Streptococcus sp. HMSC056C01]
MKKQKILSVVIPSYNAASFLKETIPTLASISSGDDIEVLIVNDGSKDETLQVAQELEKEYPGIVNIIDKENGGHGSTINAGIREAKGKYFKVVDADDWVDSGNFEKLVQFLHKTDADEIISPYTDVFEDDGTKVENNYFKDCSLKPYQDYDYVNFLEQIQILPRMHSITIKTSILRDNNIKIDENMFYVDMEYIVFPTPFIKTITYTPDSVYQYRRGYEGQSTSIQNYIKNRKMVNHVTFALLDFYNKHTLSSILENLVKETIARCVTIMTNVCLSMEDTKQGKKELIDFDQKLKSINSEFYYHKQGKKAKVLRYSNYFLFDLLSSYSKKSKKV